jgi:hypothetical protein
VPNPFGTDRLETGPGGSFRLLCRASKGWRPRTSATRRRAEHPGTAIEWQQEIFEVVAVEPVAEGTIRYSLEPWRDELAIRSLERYDAESEVGRADERRWRESAPRKRRLAILLSPLLGHLPGDVQERMEREFGAPANVMTAVSAFPLFVLGALGLFAFVARIAGGSLAPLPEPSIPLSLYLVGESSLRLVIVVTQSRPAGSIPGALAYEIWKRVAPGRSGTAVASGGRP